MDLWGFYPFLSIASDENGKTDDVYILDYLNKIGKKEAELRLIEHRDIYILYPVVIRKGYIF